ncbi:MAG: hypothetical protein K0R28_6727, partial [Paenibacillus sp.]|nr:hypothetical protein [Paenibacillus sp.]
MAKTEDERAKAKATAEAMEATAAEEARENEAAGKGGVDGGESKARGRLWSRREMIAAIGAAGVTMTAQAIIGGKSSYASNGTGTGNGDGSVTQSVYGGPGDHADHSGKLDWHNVRKQGAKGDGVHDDTEAIQQTLNKAPAEGGIVVYVPKGVYKLTAMLRIYRNTKLLLHPGAVMLRCHNDSFLLNGDAGAQYDGYEGHGSLIVEGGTWDGNVVQYPDAYVGFNFAHCRDVTVRDATIKDVVWAHAIEINASRDVLVEHCRFVGYKNA